MNKAVPILCGVIAAIGVVIAIVLGAVPQVGFFESSLSNKGIGTSEIAQAQGFITQLQSEKSKLNSTNQELRGLLQNMTDNYHNAISQNADLKNQVQLKDAQIKQLRDFQNQTITQQSQPMTIISNGTVNWYFADSKGNKYHWGMPVSSYDQNVMVSSFSSRLIPTYQLQLPNGQAITSSDYRGLAKALAQKHEWSGVIDQLYANAGSDDRFVYEVWHMVAELTTYSKDITNTNVLPVETLTRGEGDCKDKAILIADMLRSSSHATNWDIHLELMDYYNPNNPQTINHMIVVVNTVQHHYLIEATATPDNDGLNIWSSVQGWSVPFQ